MIGLQWLLDAIDVRNPIQADSKTSKPWMIDKRVDKPCPFKTLEYEAEKQIDVLTGAWAAWCVDVAESEPIVWRSRPVMIKRRTEDGHIWRVEMKFGIGEE